MTSSLILKHGLSFADLYARDGLARIDAVFVAHLAAGDAELHNRLVSARRDPDALEAKAHSQLLIDLAPHLEDFVAALFGIGAEVRALQERHRDLAPLYTVKRLFVQRRAVKGVTPEQAAALDGAALAAELEALIGEALTERSFARHVGGWMEREAESAAGLDLAARYAAWATLSPAGQAKHKAGVLFKVPHKIDPLHLVPVETIVRARRHHAAPAATDHWRAPRGLRADRCRHGPDAARWTRSTTASGATTRARTAAPRGLKDRKTGAFQKSAVRRDAGRLPARGEDLRDAHADAREGYSVGALAIIAIDNPMMAATGHRICNDCMKACIYQKQEPVDIPQAETRMLKDVLGLPWGFEIYALLTRWNPLDIRRPLPRPTSGRKVLVVGLGPAGFTLAHHLMNDGHTVVAIDGLKIEPLDAAISGVDAHGKRHAFRPIRDIDELREPRRARDGRLRRRRRIRHHRALGQELPEAGAPAAGAPRAVRDVRRRALRRHADRRERLRAGLRPHRAVRGRRQADRARHAERPGARRAPGVGLPDGAAAHRRGQGRLPSPICSCACRWW